MRVGPMWTAAAPTIFASRACSTTLRSRSWRKGCGTSVAQERAAATVSSTTMFERHWPSLACVAMLWRGMRCSEARTSLRGLRRFWQLVAQRQQQQTALRRTVARLFCLPSARCALLVPCLCAAREVARTSRAGVAQISALVVEDQSRMIATVFAQNVQMPMSWTMKTAWGAKDVPFSASGCSNDGARKLTWRLPPCRLHRSL